MALALLKRSDSDLMLPVACDDPIALAEHLSILQPFTVDVVGVWPALAGRLSFVQQALWPCHVGNGWFRAPVLHAKQAINDACQRQDATSAILPCERKPKESPQAPGTDGRDTVHLAPCERKYLNAIHRSDPPPRLTNVETSKKTIRILPVLRPHQWQNCNLVPFILQN